MTIKKKGPHINLQISAENEKKEKDANPYSVTMTLGDYCTIVELASFALPFMLGWSAPQFQESNILG